jgi:hypothetical protein
LANIVVIDDDDDDCSLYTNFKKIGIIHSSREFLLLVKTIRTRATLHNDYFQDVLILFFPQAKNIFPVGPTGQVTLPGTNFGN